MAVHNAIVELSGAINDLRERKALIVAAENVGGVKEVRDHLAWGEPISGTAIPLDRAAERE